jgi:hypothetical protein
MLKLKYLIFLSVFQKHFNLHFKNSKLTMKFFLTDHFNGVQFILHHFSQNNM